VKILVLDKFTEKLIQSAISDYLPKLQEMSLSRVQELVEMKAKVKASPDEVEAWFDKEIARTRNTDINDILKKVKP
jgi:hypothetical protein